MLEQRKYRRFASGAEITWKYDSGIEDGTEPHISWAKDLSTGGLCLVLLPGIIRGDCLQMEVRLPGGQALRLKGRVAWISTEEQIKGWTISICEGGVEFLGITDTEKATLDRCFCGSV